MSDLGYWFMTGEALLELLNAVQDGEEPYMVYAEAYANSHIDMPEDE